MTRQIPDRIQLDSGCYSLYPCLPLLPAAHPRWEMCQFGPGDSTANQRGYTARWAIDDGRLFLTGCGGSAAAASDFGWSSQSDEPRQRIGMIDIHEVETPIPATWISGDLTCPSSETFGRPLGEPIPVYFRLLRLERGMVVADLIVANTERVVDSCFRHTTERLNQAVTKRAVSVSWHVPNPVPGLAEALQSPIGTEPRPRLAALLWRAGRMDFDLLMSALRSVADPDVRRWIAYALGRIGSEAAPAVPILMHLLRAADDPAIVKALAFALAGIGLPAASKIPDIIPLVEARGGEHANAQIRLLIDSLQAKGAGAIDIFIAGLLASQSASTRHRIANGLGQIGFPAVQPLCTAFLAADNDGERADLAWALGRVGHDASPALGLLLDGLGDLQEDTARATFAAAIASIGLRSPASLASLCAAFRLARDVRALGHLADAIASLGSGAVTILIQEFETAASELAKTEIARVLGGLGPAAAPAVDCLVAAAAKSADGTFLKQVVEALRKIGAPAELLATVRIAALQQCPKGYWAEGILKELQSGAIPSEEAVWDLVGLLVETGECKAGRLMARALGAMGAIAVDPLLLALGQVRNDERRLLIIYTLGLIGPPAAAAIDDVVAAMDAADTDSLRLQLVDDLRRLGRPHERHLHTFIGILNRSSFSPVWWRLGLVIAGFGPLAVTPLVTLMEGTQDDCLHRAIRNALSEIGATAISAAPTLLAAMQTATDPRTRSALADALRACLRSSARHPPPSRVQT